MVDIKSLYGIYEKSKKDSDWRNFAMNLSQSAVLVPFINIDNSESLFTIRDIKNNEYFPIFTDFESIGEKNLFCDKKVKFAEVTLDYISNFLELNSAINHIVINPYDINIVMNQVDLAAVLSLRDSQKLFWGRPTENTSLLEANLSTIFKECSLIKRVFLQKIIVQKESSYLLVIDHQSDDDKTLFESVSQKISSEGVESDLPIDMISWSTKLGKEIADDIFPFYNVYS